MTLRPLITLFFATAAIGCASTPDGSAQALEGCWYFEQDDVVRQVGLPWGVRLTTDSLPNAPEAEDGAFARTAVTLIGPDEVADHPFGYWQPVGGDSVRLGYPGMGGYDVRMEVAENEMVGTVRSVGDAGLGQRPTRPVRLMRAACPE